jgi:hypothetical protein
LEAIEIEAADASKKEHILFSLPHLLRIGFAMWK